MNNNKQDSFRKVIHNDFLQNDFWKTSKKEWTETQEYYLNDAQKEELQNMGKLKKFIYVVFWLLRDLFLKLPQNRRIILLLSVLILFHYQHLVSSGEEGSIFLIVSITGLIFVLMLELKDKLLAQDELHAGRAVQMAMMPELLKNTDNWEIWMFSRPALEVGGDIIDYQEIDNNRLGITLGDISGKGLGAALLMVKLQATIRALADNNPDLSTLAQKVNKIYYRDKPKGSFASLVYAEPQKNGTINYFNAGHMHPICIHNGDLITRDSRSPALGLLKSAVFKVDNFQLSPGDYFIIFSDGVTEAMNDNDDLYGILRLNNIIKLASKENIEALAKAIMDDVVRFLGDNKQNDDLSLVIIKYK